MISAYGRAHGVGVGFHDDYISFRRSSGREIRIARREFPYSRDMIVTFDSYYSAVVPDARGVVDFSRPGTHRYAKSGLEFSLPSIAEEDEALEGYYYWHTPKAGDLVFDIGAHAACLPTCWRRRWVHKAKSTPSSGPYRLPHLQRNIQAHGLQNVTAVLQAIAARRGRLSFIPEGSLDRRWSMSLRDKAPATRSRWTRSPRRCLRDGGRGADLRKWISRARSLR